LAVTKDLLIKLKSEYENKGINDLKSGLKQVQSEMNQLRIAGQQGSSAFQELKSKAGFLTTEIKGLTREFKGLPKDVKMSGAQMLEMGENITIVIAGVMKAIGYLKQFAGVLIEFGKDAVQSFNASEIALAKLQNGLKNLGDEGSLKSLVDQASDLEKMSIFSDEDIMNSQAMLTTFQLTAEQIKILTPRLVDIGSAFEKTGQGEKDLQQLAIQIGKVGSGSAPNTLKRFGVIMTDAQEKALGLATGMARINMLAEILDSNFKGMGEAVGNTFAGKIRQLTNEFDNLKEVIGGKIADALLPFVAVLKEVVTYSIEVAEKFIALGDSIGTMIIDAIGGTKVFSDLKQTVFQLIDTGINRLIAFIKDLIPAFQGVWLEVGRVMKQLSKSGLLGVIETIASVGTSVFGAWIKFMLWQFEKMGQAVEFSLSIFNKFKNLIAQSWIARVFDSAIKALKYMIDTAKKGYNEIAKVLRLIGIDIQSPDEAKNTEANQGEIGESFSTKTYGSNDTNSSTGSSKETQKLTTDLSRLQDQLEKTKKEFDLLKTELTSQGVVWDDNTIAIKEYLDAIKKLQQQIDFKKLNLKDFKIPEAGTLPAYQDSGKGVEIDKQGAFDNDIRKSKEDEKRKEAEKEAAGVFVSSIGTALNGIISNLGLHGETAVARIAQGFERVVGIVQTIQAVFAAIQAAQQAVSFLKTVFPFLADGGDVSAGKPYIVGDAPGGRLTPYSELFVPRTAGTIYSNSQLMNMLKGNSANNVLSQPKTTVVNKYFSLEQDGIRFLEKNLPAYVNKKNFRQL